MLGDSTTLLASTPSASANRGGEAPAAGPPPPPSSHLEAAAHHAAGNNNNSGHDQSGGDDGDRSFGGNRWPREETLALLRVRSDMDVAFRDASVKGPLWEEVSRKLAELGYHRSAKKCKEKFENVYKYHKRTKEGRSGKHEGKTYRFFDQLEAFESHPPPSYQPPKLQQPPPIVTTLPMPAANPLPPVTAATVPSKNVLDQGAISTGINLTVTPPFSVSTANPTVNPMPSFSGDLMSNSTSSSSTSSDVEVQGRRKRKWKDFFEGLMKEVIQRQEEMQKRFLEAIEKREHERMAREESWRMQEMARINREREILAQERSMASAKDAAVMAFLQKLSEQQNQQGQHNINPLIQPVQAATTPPPSKPAPVTTLTPTPVVAPQPLQTISATQQQPATVSSTPQQQQPTTAVLTPTSVQGQEARPDNNGDQLTSGPSSSRWPKVEVEALIHLRTNLDSKYQENGPKGPLWEEISAGMRKLGYNRNAKRCKEKWENINKYFKKVKESNKKRPEDSKTCPYFHQLDALYREKNASTPQFKPENSVPLMVRPEQQWPPPPAPPPASQPPPHLGLDDLESDQDHDDKDNEDDEDEDEAGGYEIVPNRQTSISSAG